MDGVTLSLQEPSTKSLKWFVDDQMKGNTDEYHLIVSTGHNTKTQVAD